MTLDVNYVWRQLLSDLLLVGNHVSPRGISTVELVSHRTIVPMSQPLLTVHERNLSTQFACAEAAWILSGDNRLKTLLPFAPSYAKFSDDGLTLAGAYGPPLLDQLPFVLKTLIEDSSSRQAVATIWRPRPGSSKDVPCTVAVQWIIRNDRLHCIDSMRSSDAWLGWPYDIFSFSMISAFLALRLRMRGLKVDLGNVYLTAGSQHLYEKNYETARACTRSDEVLDRTYAPLELDQFNSSDEDFVEDLWRIARKQLARSDWLRELHS